MIITGMLQKLNTIMDSILGHFVTGSVTRFSPAGDFEWQMDQPTPLAMTTKGNYLTGALADIVVYGMILVDWLVQALLGTGTDITG